MFQNHSQLRNIIDDYIVKSLFCICRHNAVILLQEYTKCHSYERAAGVMKKVRCEYLTINSISSNSMTGILLYRLVIVFAF